MKYLALILTLVAIGCAKKSDETTVDQQKASPEIVNEFKRDYLPPSLPVLPDQ